MAPGPNLSRIDCRRFVQRAVCLFSYTRMYPMGTQSLHPLKDYKVHDSIVNTYNNFKLKMRNQDIPLKRGKIPFLGIAKFGWNGWLLMALVVNTTHNVIRCIVNCISVVHQIPAAILEKIKSQHLII